jgi:uncharacterized protein
MADNNKEILQKANALITEGDHEGFLAFCTEDTLWTFVGDKTLQGKEAVRQWMATTYIEPPRFTVENLIEGGRLCYSVGQNYHEGRNWKIYRLLVLRCMAI